MLRVSHGTFMPQRMDSHSKVCVRALENVGKTAAEQRSGEPYDVTCSRAYTIKAAMAAEDSDR
jgi:hypothetical protein